MPANSRWDLIRRLRVKANSENDASFVKSSDDDWIQYLHVWWAHETHAILGGLDDDHYDVCDYTVS